MTAISRRAVENLLNAEQTVLEESSTASPVLAALDELALHLRRQREESPTLSKDSKTDGNDENSNNHTTVRSALGVKSADMARLISLLTTLMGDRVATANLLPLTYDEDANEQAMSGEAALTLTRSSLSAAAIYAGLLGMPGALGAGLVQMQALSALAALLRRWTVECCSVKDIREKKKRGRTERGRSSPNARPRKTSRREFFDDDDDDDDSGPSVVSEERTTALELDELVTLGLQVALAVSPVPLQTEFVDWSSEARDSLINTVATVLGTSAALASGRSSPIVELSNTVVSTASRTIQTALRSSSRSIEPVDDNLPTKQLETAKSILRGLFPIISMNETLPKGESGRLGAAFQASRALEGFIGEVVKSTNVAQKRLSFGGRRSSIGSTAPTLNAVTPKSGRRLQTSLGGGGSARRGGEQVTPPKLKSSKTSGRSSLSSTHHRFGNRPRPILCAILGILQKLATDKGLDKASVRNAAVDTLQSCLKHLPVMERTRFLTFLIQLCHSKISVHRLVGAEVLGRIVMEEWLWSEHSNDAVGEPKPSSPALRRQSLSPLVSRSSDNMPEALFLALLGRLQDRAPAIRTASTGSLSDILRRLREGSSVEESEPLWVAGLKEILKRESDSLVESIRRRAGDEKATVRRAAVDVLAELFLVLGRSSVNVFVDETDLETLSELCKDDAVMVRRAAAEALTRLLEASTASENCIMSSELEKAWPDSVLTMVLDTESTCGSKAVELVDRVLLAPIVHASQHIQSETQAAWRILADLCDGSGPQIGSSRSQTEALRCALAQMETSSSTYKGFFKDLLKTICEECISTLVRSKEDDNDTIFRRSGAWCLLDALVSHSKNTNETARIVKQSRIDMDFVGTAWKTLLDLSSRASGESRVHLQRSMKKCFQVLAKLAPCVDPSLSQKSSSKLQLLLKNFSFPTEIVGSAVSSLIATTVVCREDQDPKVMCGELVRELFTTCEDRIAGAIDSGVSGEDLQSLLRAIFSVGEVSLVGFNAGDDEQPSSGAGSNSENESSVRDSVRGLHEKPSKKLLDLVQACLLHSLPGSERISTPEPVRAHAFIAIGKLCLRDAFLAKDSVTILVRELHENMQQGSWKVQSNALIVLGDLCVKYTNMVDRFLPVMAACMQAGVTDFSTNLLRAQTSQGVALVRKHAVMILSNLLLQDFVKWRGLLFHRFLVAACDEDEEVASLAQLLLCGPLITKQPRLFANHFVESLFVLNRCTAHPVFVAAAAMGDGGSGVSVGFEGINLIGEAGRVQREQMYHLMLSRMTDEEKIGVTARIAKEVLGSALDTGSDLNRVCTTPASSSTENDGSYECAANVLSDALSLLSNPHMRIGKGAKRQSEDDIEDPNVSTNSSKKLLVAKSRLLSKISRKHLIEIILPILCRLKAVLQKSCSGLLKDLMLFFVNFYFQNKSEVEEFLANDPILLEEIKYDAKHFRKSRGLSCTPSTVSTSTTTPSTAATDEPRP